MGSPSECARGLGKASEGVDKKCGRLRLAWPPSPPQRLAHRSASPVVRLSLVCIAAARISRQPFRPLACERFSLPEHQSRPCHRPQDERRVRRAGRGQPAG
eukprot:366462-Chlamydomonas_euryale.AAC.9